MFTFGGSSRKTKTNGNKMQKLPKKKKKNGSAGVQGQRMKPGRGWGRGFLSHMSVCSFASPEKCPELCVPPSLLMTQNRSSSSSLDL